MSRRPQEPPRSVGRDHRLTFLKTSGIDVSYSRRVGAVKRFVVRADLCRQIRNLQIGRFAPQAPRTHSLTKIRKIVNTAFEILLLRRRLPPYNIALTPAAARPPHRPRKSPSHLSARRPG